MIEDQRQMSWCPWSEGGGPSHRVLHKLEKEMEETGEEWSESTQFHEGVTGAEC